MTLYPLAAAAIGLAVGGGGCFALRVIEAARRRRDRH